MASPVAVKDNEHPDRLNDAKRPRACKEAVDTRQGASECEREDEGLVAALQGVHEHHEGEGEYAEEGHRHPGDDTDASGSGRNVPRLGEREAQASEHHQVGVKPDALDAAHP